MPEETRGHGVVNLEEYNNSIIRLEVYGREHNLGEDYFEIVNVLKNMPKVVTNDPAPVE